MILIAVIIGWYVFFGQGKSEPYQYNPPYPVPQGTIHWHPYLKIIINGEERLIPDNVGIGSTHYPIHTHELADDPTEYTGAGRKIHMENGAPSRNIETLTLGYFFKVWNKKFNATCIMEFCNGADGEMKVFVNGKQNFDYDHYFMSDGDQILIEYK